MNKKIFQNPRFRIFQNLDLGFVWKLEIRNWKSPPTPRGASGGQAAIILVVFLMSTMIILTGSFGTLALRQAKIVRAAGYSAQSYFLAESGIEDALYRIKTGRIISSTEVITLNGASATVTITQEGSTQKVSSRGDVKNHIRKIDATLSLGDGVEFNYGMHAGEGGVNLKNSSSIVGNLFSGGPVVGENNNLIEGTVVSTGPNGSVDGIHATSSVYANNITDSFIEEDAYYQTIDGSTVVLGTKYPDSTDVAMTNLAISDEMLDEWEQVAEAGGTISSPCPYVINDDETLGPIKINCDLDIRGSAQVTLLGMVWVVGDVTVRNTSVVRIASSLGEKSLAIIADNPNDRINSSTAISKNTVIFRGSGAEDSYVLLVSRNESASQGGTKEAIEVSNQSDAGELLVYAPHGKIDLGNKVVIREVSAYRIIIRNSAQIVYKTGLASLLFDTGPSGGYDIIDWKEVE